MKSRKVTPGRLMHDAVEHYEDAERSAQAGECHASFGSLELASFNHGEAVGRAGADRATLAQYRTLADAAFRAEEEFAARCMRRR